MALIFYPNLIRRLQMPALRRALALKSHMSCLDLGCGNGSLCDLMRGEARVVYACDIRKSGSWRRCLGKANRPRFLVANAHRLPFKDRVFDRILVSSVLQMVSDDRRLLQEIARVCRSDGLVIVSVPSCYRWIQILYKGHEPVRRAFRHLLRLPMQYEHLLARLCREFGVSGRGYYPLPDVIQLIMENGFDIVSTEYSPKSWGSMIFETTLLLRLALGLKPTHWSTVLLLPLALPDRFLSMRSLGCELVISARRR